MYTRIRVVDEGIPLGTMNELKMLRPRLPEYRFRGSHDGSHKTRRDVLHKQSLVLHDHHPNRR